MIFYKEKRYYFWMALILSILSFLLGQILMGIVLIIASIIFYMNGYINNTKYVVDDFEIKSYDSKRKLLKNNRFSEGYSIKRVIRGTGKYAKVWVEFRVGNNLYDFKWNKRIIKKLGKYINTSKVLKEHSKDNFKAIILITLIFVFSFFISIFLMANGFI